MTTKEPTLAELEQLSAVASLEVTRTREAHALGGSRSAWMKASRVLATAQEDLEFGRLRARLAGRAADAEQQAAAAIHHRETAERQKRASAAFADLTSKVGVFVADTRAGFDAIEAAARAVNSSDDAGSLMASFHPPSAFPVIHDHLMDSLTRLAEVFPRPPKPTTIITTATNEEN